MVIFIVLFYNTQQPGSFFFTFAFLMFLGQGCNLLMLAFPKTAKFEVEKHPVLDSRMKIFVVSGVLLICYFVFWVIELVVWTETYIEQ